MAQVVNKSFEKHERARFTKEVHLMAYSILIIDNKILILLNLTVEMSNKIKQ